MAVPSTAFWDICPFYCFCGGVNVSRSLKLLWNLNQFWSLEVEMVGLSYNDFGGYLDT